MIVNENAKLKHFRQALVMRLLFAFRTCRKKPLHYQQTAQSARAIPASQRMNTISTTKATSFSPNNTTSAADTAAKASVNTVLTETKNHNFLGVPTPSEWSGCTLEVLVPANSRKILRLYTGTAGFPLPSLTRMEFSLE
jgi:hypothetical protein